MHVTVGDVNFYDGLECLYVKNKSRASTARELPNIVRIMFTVVALGPVTC